MSLTYTSFVTDLANLLAVPSSDANFTTVVPNIIDYAEQRIYRDCDFLTTIIRSTTVALSTQSRNFTLPSSVTIVVVESVNVWGPTSSAPTQRYPLAQVSRDYLDSVWPQETSTSAATIPSYFAMITDQTAIVGPPPGSPYPIEIAATTRPVALSSGNSSTYLTTNLPDLFLTAACLYGAAYLKNFGAASDDPRSGQTWESVYQSLLQSALVEEQRKKSQGPAWTPKSAALAGPRV